MNARWMFPGVVVAVVAALSAPGAVASRISPPGAVATRSGLPWLHVEHPLGELPYIADDHGRTILLRGVNANGLQDDYYDVSPPGPQPTAAFWTIDPADYDGHCPINSHAIVDPPLCEVDAGAGLHARSADGSQNDFAQMRALGFNVVRLTLSWSLLEPRPGQYSTAYLDRIAQVVGWAKEQGMYVLLDMHQDSYSRFIDETTSLAAPPLITAVKGSGNHSDGAPAWAIVDDGVPSSAPFGVSELDLQSGAAFTAFWANRLAPDGVGLQDHYIGAVAALAQRFDDESAVAGYELMNEPQSGTIAAPGGFDQGVLYPFYRRVIDAVTGVADGALCPSSTPAVPACGYRSLGINDRRHLIFFEPWAVRNLFDASPQLSAPFSTYPNVVYAPHTYTHVFTADRTLAGVVPVPGASSVPIPYPASYDQAFDTAAAEATALGAALFIGEFGNGSDQDESILRAETDAQDRHLTGSTVWEWKNTCHATEVCADSWGTYTSDPADPPMQNGSLKSSRVRFLSRIVPRATVGRLRSFAYNPDDQSFTMTADASATATSPRALTDVYIPPNIGGTVAVTGSAALDRVVTNPDGSRDAFIAPTGGSYHVAVSPHE